MQVPIAEDTKICSALIGQTLLRDLLRLPRAHLQSAIYKFLFDPPMHCFMNIKEWEKYLPGCSKSAFHSQKVLEGFPKARAPQPKHHPYSGLKKTFV